MEEIEQEPARDPGRRRRLSELMRKRRGEILQTWAASIGTQPTVPRHPAVLLDRVPNLLERIAELTDALDGGESSTWPTDDVELHASERLDRGFDLHQIAIEYALLRDSIATVLEARDGVELKSRDLRVLARAVDEALAASITRYTRVRDRTVQAFDRIAIVSLESSSLDELLERLLNVLKGTLHAVDAASILLRTGDRLIVRAAVGADGDVGSSVAIGEGLAGTVAAKKSPLLAHEGDARFALGRGVRARYAMPLVEANETIGVAQMGSLTVDEFSEEEVNLFATMAARATAATYQHLLLETAESRSAELAALLESLPAAVVIGDQHGMTRANRAAMELVGAEEMYIHSQTATALAARMHVRDADTDEDIAPGEDPFTLALGGAAVSRELKVRHQKTNQEIVVRSLAAPIRRGNEIIGAVSVNIDMTERKQLEESLRRQEHDQRFLANATKALSSVFAYPDTLEEIARRAVPELADWCIVDVVEADGTKRVAVAHSDPAKLAFAQDWTRRYPFDFDGSYGIAQVIRTGEPLLVADVSDENNVAAARDDGELALMRALGPRSFIAVPLVARGRTFGAISVIAAESGRRYGVADVELLQEVGRRAGIAVDNSRLYLQAKEAVGMREEILAVVSHDLKNPLSAIRMAAFSLMRDGDPRQAKYADAIDRNAARMDLMIKDLLDMASLHAGRLSLERTRSDPATLLGEVFDQYEPLARQKSIKLTIGSLLEGATLDCDRSRILQVFGNLLDNAIKFCSEGDEIDVRGEAVREGAKFVVMDTGPGIPAADLDHIFEPYWSAKRHAKLGTGLGLYISKGIIEAHGGRLWAESQVGHGAAFHFTLPLV